MVVVFGYLGCIILPIVFLRFLFSFIYNNGLPINWPFVGMLPTMLLYLHGAHDKVAEVLKRSNGTYQYKGIWFTNTSFLGTSDPENVRYILSTNNATYVKGSEWRKQFDILGACVFNSEGDVWKHHRKVFHAFLNHPQFHISLENVLQSHLEHELVKVLDSVSIKGILVNLQDLFARHALDVGCIMATGCNPEMLSIEFSEDRFSEAVSNSMEAAFYRYVLPDNLWKLQSWLQIGLEKRRTDAWKALDDILAEFTSIQREKSNKNEESNFNFLNCYLTSHKVTGPTPSDSIIRDNVLFFMIATYMPFSIALTWFFFFLSKNPLVETKIREEAMKNLSMKRVGGVQLLSCFNELNKLTYLHAAICETLRLSPPIPFDYRTCTKHDILPSGHHVPKNMRVVIAIHAMGRMEALWGKDCIEFKPERWITKEGRIKNEPPNKFSAFITGPKVCAGKNLSFILMKATIATVIQNYEVHVIEGQKIAPKESVLYQMKNGLLATIKNRGK